MDEELTKGELFEVFNLLVLLSLQRAHSVREQLDAAKDHQEKTGIHLDPETQQRLEREWTQHLAVSEIAMSLFKAKANGGHEPLELLDKTRDIIVRSLEAGRAGGLGVEELNSGVDWDKELKELAEGEDGHAGK